ncbi:MAG: hypothetical protein IH999_00755 [Proteobacteria bacterium]|nr:hypothetical protein [Pseudomonadota bacterium]
MAVLAAGGATVAGAAIPIGFYFTLDPTMITTAVIITTAAAALTGLAWLYSAILSLRNCLKSDPEADRKVIEDLQRRVEELEKRVSKHEGD